MKKTKIMAFILAALISGQTFTSLAFSKEGYNYRRNLYSSSDLRLLSPEKERELQKLADEFNMSSQEVNELRALYDVNFAEVTPRIKFAIIEKVVKAAAKVSSKVLKKFGLALGEQAISDLTDYLFGWQDDLEEGIKTFLVNNLGWWDAPADWTAKAIMFLVF